MSMNQQFINGDISLAVEADYPRIFAIWKSAVCETHTFLSAADIQLLIPFVQEAIASSKILYCCRDAERNASGFMEVVNAKIEMLFVHPEHRAKGIGSKLMDYAICHLGATLVDVNEQNLSAVGFYEQLGFYPIGRSVRDPLGKPYPILHMQLDTAIYTARHG